MKTREVVFYSEGAKMVGDIYLPDDYKEGEKRPAVLCNSGWTGVNKCYPALFARALTARGCNKAAEFVNFCDAFSIPVLTLTNVAGFAATVESEKNMAKAVARLTYAFANATVPKVNVIVGKAFGSAYVAMNSKSVGADLVYAWPTAEIGMMDAKLAAQIMYPDADADTQSAKAAKYKELQSSPNAAAARGYVDAIIEPADTRKYVIGAFEMLFTKRENRPDKKHGTV